MASRRPPAALSLARSNCISRASISTLASTASSATAVASQTGQPIRPSTSRSQRGATPMAYIQPWNGGLGWR